MLPVDLIAVLGTVAFAGVFVGSSLLAGSGFGLEKRASLLERRDPGTAAALRRAQFMSDFPAGGMFGDEGFSAICTPSRRSAAAVPGSRRSSSDARFSRPKPLPASRLLPTKTPANATVPSTAMRSTGIMRNPLFERTSVYSRAPSSGLPGCRDIPPRRAWCRRGRSMLRGWGTRP